MAGGSIEATALPAQALASRYRTAGNHVDCYRVEVPGEVPVERFVEAFLTSRAFRPERWLIGLLLGRPASNAQAAALAKGDIERFSA